MNNVKQNFAAAFVFALLAGGSLVSGASAQVPNLINYQGLVTVGGSSFTGAGQFNFALVDPAGTTTYWSNDGTSTGGSEPTTAVSLAVANGIFTVVLGDPSLANMTAIPATVFTNNSDVRLRVWFNDATHGAQLLMPDQRVVAVGYAIRAASADTVAPTATLPATQLTGTVTTAQLADGSVSAAKLAGNGCVEQQILKYESGAWTCADDAGSTGAASGIVSGVVVVNVPGSGHVNLTPAALGFPSDTLTRNPIVLRASAWTGTSTSAATLLLTAVGPLDSGGSPSWPVVVFDPSGVFTTGAAYVEVVLRLDPP